MLIHFLKWIKWFFGRKLSKNDHGEHPGVQVCMVIFIKNNKVTVNINIVFCLHYSNEWTENIRFTLIFLAAYFRLSMHKLITICFLVKNIIAKITQRTFLMRILLPCAYISEEYVWQKDTENRQRISLDMQRKIMELDNWQYFRDASAI